MRVLIGTEVKTACGNFPFVDREQAEAYLMSLRLRDRQRPAQATAKTAPPSSPSSSRPTLAPPSS